MDFFLVNLQTVRCQDLTYFARKISCHISFAVIFNKIFNAVSARNLLEIKFLLISLKKY